MEKIWDEWLQMVHLALRPNNSQYHFGPLVWNELFFEGVYYHSSADTPEVVTTTPPNWTTPLVIVDDAKINLLSI